MAQLSAAAYAAKYIDPTTGLFKPNGTKAITAARLNEFVTDTADSVLNLITLFGSYSRQANAFGTDTYTATITTSTSTLFSNGAIILLYFENTSTGASSVTINGTTKKIFLDLTTQADADDLQAGLPYEFVYDGDLDTGAGGWLMKRGAGAGGSVSAWGDLTGTITDQTDLVSYVAAQILSAVEGLKWKNSVKVATTANGTLATAYENGDTVDGVTLVTGDRILLKNQSTQSENGIYIVAASGAPSRAGDANAAAELEGAAVSVQQGTSNANTTWIQTTDGITLGSSNIVWSQLGTSVPDASDTTKGIVELATSAETITGTDTTRAVTPSGFKAGVDSVRPKVVQFAASDEVTPITASTNKISFRMPYAMTLTEVRASLRTAQASGSIFTVDINEGGSTILSTKLTIDNTEKTSTTAATPPVISDTALADDAEITVDVDQIGNGSAVGLKITLIGI